MVVLDVDPEVFLLYDNGLIRILLVVGVELLGLYLQDLYSDVKIYSRILIVQANLAGGRHRLHFAGLAWILESQLDCHSLDDDRRQRLPALVLLPAWRIMYSRFMLKALGHRRILFLGESVTLEELAAGLMARPELGSSSVLGYINDTAHDPVAPSSDPETPAPVAMTHLGPVVDLRTIVGDAKPDMIVVGMTERRNRLPVNELLDLRFAGVPVMEIASLYEAAFGRVCTRELRPSQLIFSEELGPDQTSVSIQSAYAFILALIGMILAAPIIVLLVALLVRLTSPGPVLLRQTRVGLHGEPFTVYKFRSMYQDAEARTGAVWAVKNDPRITPVGSYLRRFRLDELPQLFNVLKGDMSIAGPRPERPEFVATLAGKDPLLPAATRE